MTASRKVVAALLVVLGAGAAHARTEDPPELIAERDQLIEKITAGKDYAASVKRFKELIAARDKVIATSAAAIQAERQRQEQERTARQERHNMLEAWRKTADYDVSWRCTLSADPAHPVPSTEGRFTGDWGKVVRKEKARKPPKNELDDGEPVTLYEVKGQARSYQFMGERFAKDHKPFEANVGDLVLVCNGGEDIGRDIPAGWGPRLVRSGFAARLASAPLIARKMKWNPIHITNSNFFWAIKDVKWKYPPDAFVLSVIEIKADLGGGRYEIPTNNDLSFILEVPPSVKVKEPLIPGRSVWAIMGHQRFDRALKKLVLVAEDLEPHYIDEKN